MAGRPKIQFNDAEGKRVWELLPAIIAERERRLNNKIETLIEELSTPGLQIEHKVRLSAGKMILILLEEEYKRLALGGIRNDET